MSQRRSICALVIVLLLGMTRKVAAEPVNPCTPSEPCHLRMREDTTLTKDNGQQYRLPPGRFFDEPTFQELDTELKRLQNQETRLSAENKSLMESLDTWRPGWLAITTAVLVGIGGGVGGYYWYTTR